MSYIKVFIYIMSFQRHITNMKWEQRVSELCQIIVLYNVVSEPLYLLDMSNVLTTILFSGLSETHPAIHALTSVLTTGPVGPADRIGKTNVSLLMRYVHEIHPKRFLDIM